MAAVQRPTIGPGFRDHGFEVFCGFWPVQRPRHFRVCLSVLSFSLIIGFVATFFTAVAFLASMSVGPAWERLHAAGHPNDAAVFFSVADRGELTYRVCNGSVTWDCMECDDSNVVEANGSASSGSNSSKYNVSLLPSSSSSSNRRGSESTSRHPNDCECGADIHWDRCAFDNSALACSAVSKAAKELFDVEIIYVALAFALPPTIWIFLLPALSCMRSPSWRYLRPAAAQIILVVVGVVVPAILAYFAIATHSKAVIATDGNIKCDDGLTLAARGFLRTGMDDVFRTSIASIFFTIGLAVWEFLGHVFILLFPKPTASHPCYLLPYSPEVDDCCDDSCGCCECCCDGKYGENTDWCCCTCYNDYEIGATTATTNPDYPNDPSNDILNGRTAYPPVTIQPAPGASWNVDPVSQVQNDFPFALPTSGIDNRNFSGMPDENNDDDAISMNSDDNPDHFTRATAVVGIPIYNFNNQQQ